MTRIQTYLLNFHQSLRGLKYRLLSDCKHVEGIPIAHQPVQLTGKGRIKFHREVHLGFYPSPFYLSGYIYIEARNNDSVIEIGDDVWMNNNTFLISAGPGISIGKGSMLGVNCEIIDSDFHHTHPDKRKNGEPNTGRVVIGQNVLIGSNVKILKGVQIGNHSIISNGSVVTRSFGENCLIYGNPAKGGLGLRDPADPNA